MRSVQPLNQNISDNINVAEVMELQVLQKISGNPRFTLLMWGHIKNRGKQKPRKSKLLSITKGEENRIEL